MSILSGVSELFGLDIGTTGLRVVQLRGSGATKSLYVYNQSDLDLRTALSDAAEDQNRLGAAIKEFIGQSGVTTNNVAVGLPTSKVFTTVVDMQRLGQEEMAGTIKYQADSIIPTPIEQSKIDWAIIGDSPKDSSKVEVILSSVSNAFVEKRLDLLEGIGLNVVAFEPDAMALARALIPSSVQTSQMVIDMGHSSTDLIICMKDSPRLVRSIPIGSNSLVRGVSTHLAIDENQATQFLFKFGLSQDKLDGKIYHATIDIVDGLVSEAEKSNKFFKERYSTAVEKVIISGAAAIIPEFPVYLANKLGISVEIGNAWTNVNFPSNQQNELMALANRFGVAAGLAERQT